MPETPVPPDPRVPLTLWGVVPDDPGRPEGPGGGSTSPGEPPGVGLARIDPRVNPARVYHDTRAAGSRAAIRAVLCRIAGWLLGLDRRATWSEACALPWWEVRARHVALVRVRLVEVAAPATVNRDLSVLRGVITVAWENEQVSTDAYTRAVHIKGVDKDHAKAGRALSVAELRTLVEAAKGTPQTPGDPRTLAALALMYGAGLRRAEVVAVQVEDVDLGAQRLTLLGKRRKRRVAHLAPGWAKLVEPWLRTRPASGPLFDVRSPESVWRWITDLRERSGVTRFTPHDLRRSFGTHLLASGKDLVIVRDLLGHNDVRTTALYDRRGETEAAAAVADLMRPEE